MGGTSPGVVRGQYEYDTHPVENDKAGADVPFEEWVMLSDVVRSPAQVFENEKHVVDLIN